MTIVAAALLSWALPASGGGRTTCQETVIPLGVLDPGVPTQHRGFTCIRGMRLLQMELSAEPLLQARATVTMDLRVDAKGDFVAHGIVIKEVGTWDLTTDPQNPKFTPTGGVWEGTVDAQGTGFPTAPVSVAHGTLYGTRGEVGGMQYSFHGGGPASLYAVQLLPPRTPDQEFDLVLPGIEIRPGVAMDIHAKVFVNGEHQSEGETVLAVHAMLCSASTWKPLATALFTDNPAGRKVSRVVALNLPGPDRSGLPDPALLPVDQINLDDYVGALLGALEALQAKKIRPETLLGHSLGGGVIQLAQQRLIRQGTSLRDQYHIKNVVLLASGARLPNPGPSIWWYYIELFPPNAPFFGTTDAGWQGICANTSGVLVTATPSVAEITANHYNAAEPMSVVKDSSGYPPYVAPAVDPGIFAPRYRTTFQAVSYEQDPFGGDTADAEAAYEYLTGDAHLTHFAVLPGSDTCHALHVVQPWRVLESVADKITLP